jgi:hypothetical protein
MPPRCIGDTNRGAWHRPHWDLPIDRAMPPGQRETCSMMVIGIDAPYRGGLDFDPRVLRHRSGGTGHFCCKAFALSLRGFERLILILSPQESGGGCLATPAGQLQFSLPALPTRPDSGPTEESASRSGCPMKHGVLHHNSDVLAQSRVRLTAWWNPADNRYK